MILRIPLCVFNAEKIEKNHDLKIESSILKESGTAIEVSDCIAYPPFINSHDHLIGNWYPRAGKAKSYPNSDVWVEDMKNAPSYLERNKIWENDNKYNLLDENAQLLISLGVYKNLFSGCAAVQDHIPNQKPLYYRKYPIDIIENYRQCHSITMGNWWGGKPAREELAETNGKMPFIIHLAEGIDEKSKSEFAKFEKENLLQPNTIIVHGIALTENDIKKCGEVGTSICWCPDSNMFLIGETLDAKTCLKYGVNLLLGTDSTMSGGINLFSEIRTVKEIFPDFPNTEILKMITTNAQKALFLPENYGKLESETSELLLLKKKTDDPFENLLLCDIEDIELFIHAGKPIYGDEKYLEYFNIEPENYFFFSLGKTKKFVSGHPEKTSRKIDEILGYHKDFPFLPF